MVKGNYFGVRLFGFKSGFATYLLLTLGKLLNLSGIQFAHLQNGIIRWGSDELLQVKYWNSAWHIVSPQPVSAIVILHTIILPYYFPIWGGSMLDKENTEITGFSCFGNLLFCSVVHQYSQ